MTIRTNSSIMPVKLTIFRDDSNKMPVIDIPELCLKKPFQRQIFIEAIEEEVARGVLLFKNIDVYDQRIIIKKLFNALDEPFYWFHDSRDKDEVLNAILPYKLIPIGERAGGVRFANENFIEEFFDLAINHFEAMLDELMSNKYSELEECRGRSFDEDYDRHSCDYSESSVRGGF